MNKPGPLEPSDREELLFHAAAQLRDPAKRALYLDWACEGNPELRARVEKLLANDNGDNFFAQPLAGPAALSRLPAETLSAAVQEQGVGERIGRYKLLQKIGEGGCGIVYMAEQEEPVRRRVALKIIRLGMDTQSVIARFEAERQALALMDHPNIAKILDGGVTETGRPYFVMDLVQGLPIIQFCDEAQLPTKERLALIMEVCSAIQHAHQKGIIHRDIKPSNILVTLHGERPVPKVIDFGIAKATQQRLTDKTLFTQFQHFIGTPAYMSPEQATLSGLDIDTRSDIYSLGVLLYELLTGKTPFDSKELLQAGVDEMCRTIREKEPARPSMRLSTLGQDELTTTAQRRALPAPKLISLLRGDLDWIVMKCLEKDRARRYETANGLARDIERHINNEPVVASPPSKAYRFHKLVQRNKLVFAAVGTVLVVLTASTIISTYEYVGKAKAESKQNNLRQQAQDLAANETRLRAAANRELFDSLLAQARSTRLARQVGYRERALTLLRKAGAMDVPQRNVTVLRREALACMGDFVGLQPSIFSVSADDVQIVSSPRFDPTGRSTRFDPTGQTAAFLMSDGSIVLREVTSGKQVGCLTGEYLPRDACFAAQGNEVISLHYPPCDFTYRTTKALLECVSKAQLIVWRRQSTGVWTQVSKKSVPGATGLCNSAAGIYLLVFEPSPLTVKLVDACTMATVASFAFSLKSPLDVSAAELSPDGQYFVVSFKPESEESSLHDVIEMYGVRTGQRVHRWEPRAGQVQSLTFSPDGKFLGALMTMGGRIYSLEEPERVLEFYGYFLPPSRVAFAPDRSIVALPLFQEQRIRLWDWRKNQDIASLDTGSGRPSEISFSPDGQILTVSGGRQMCVYAMSTADGKLRLPGHANAVTGLAFSPDGRVLASTGKDRALRTWDALTGRMKWENAALPTAGQTVAYSPDGRLVVTGGDAGWIWICSAADGKLLLELKTDGLDWVWSTEFSHDGRHLAVASAGEAGRAGIHIWRIGSGSSSGQLTANPEIFKFFKDFTDCRNLSFSPDDSRLAFCGLLSIWRHNYAVDLWEFQSSSPPRRFLTNAIGGLPQYLSFSGQGHQLLVGESEAGTLAVLDVETGKTTPFFAANGSTEHSTYVQGRHSLSPDESMLAHPSDSGLSLDIWDTKNKGLIYPLPEENGSVYWMAWSPDSRRLAVSRSNGDIAIWSLDQMAKFLAQLDLQR